MKERVMVGMSGGVDSSTAALLLLEQGYEVVGVTLNLIPDNEKAVAEQESAKAAAKVLGIELLIYDLREMFAKSVIDYFINEYKAGRTPNPCVVCNPTIKFGAMLDYVLENKANYLATGHYALIEQHPETQEYLLKKSPSCKDQSYFLHRLNQNQLKHTLFPLGSFSKDEVRALAENFGLSNAKKSDSQEICFTDKGHYAKFIKEYSGVQPIEGNFIDENGNVLGRHKGIIDFTVGQRKGLGVSFGTPMYVKKINIQDNTITLGKEESRYNKSLIAENINWISGHAPKENFKAGVKVRSTSKAASAEIFPIDDKSAKIVFDVPALSITPGQSAVMYDGDTVLGGGFIL